MHCRPIGPIHHPVCSPDGTMIWTIVHCAFGRILEMTIHKLWSAPNEVTSKSSLNAASNCLAVTPYATHLLQLYPDTSADKRVIASACMTCLPLASDSIPWQGLMDISRVRSSNHDCPCNQSCSRKFRVTSYSMTKQAHMFRQSWPRKYIAYLNSRSWHGFGHNLSRLNLVAGQETFVWKTLYTEPQNSHPEDPDALECCKVSPVMKVPHWRTLSRPTWSRLKCVVRKTGLKTNLLQTLKALPIGHFLPTWCCHARSSLSFISWTGLAKTWTCLPSPSENHPSWMYKLTGSNLVMI